MPVLDLLDEDSVVDALQIGADLFLCFFHGYHVGKASVLQVFRKGGIPLGVGDLRVLPERKRQHGQLYAAAGEQGGQITGEQVGVGAGDVEIIFSKRIKL